MFIQACTYMYKNMDNIKMQIKNLGSILMFYASTI
jgi:hypothetical protein